MRLAQRRQVRVGGRDPHAVASPDMPTDAGPSVPQHPLRGATVALLGASGAVGSALLRRLLAIGAKPAISVHRAWQVSAMRTALGGAPGIVVHVDPRDGEAAAGFVKGANDTLGPVHAFISTAGAFRTAPIGRTVQNDDLDLMEANFFAVHNLVRAVVGPMVRRKTGRIVVIGSASVGLGGANTSLYLASKAALHEYVRALAIELEPEGVGVALVTPGTIDTPANRGAMPDADRTGWTPIGTVVDWLITGASGETSRGSGEPLLRLPHVEDARL